MALTLAAGPSSAAPLVPIYDIQGRGHLSPYAGQAVRTTGHVTYLAKDGYYLQDEDGDGDDATSDAIFVHTGPKPGVQLHDWIEVEGEVVEFIPGGPATNNLSITRLESTLLLPTAIDPPVWNGQPVIIGAGGRIPPAEIIDDDGMTIYDPDKDGLDFFESLEGMLVTLPAPVVVCPSNAKAEMYCVVDGGANSSGMSQRGTLKVAPGDYHPERIQIQETQLRLGPGPAGGPLDVGDRLQDVTGVLGYDGMYEVLSPQSVSMTPGGLAPAISRVVPSPGRLRIATYNVAGLDPHLEDAALTDQGDGDFDDDVDDDVGAGRFAAIANHIVVNLLAPDLIALQEVQDSDGAELSPVTAADETLQLLVDAIVAAGGPAYHFLDTPAANVNPDTGVPGTHPRNAFLYNPDRVSSLGLTPLPVLDAFREAPAPLGAHFSLTTAPDMPVFVLNVQLSDRAGGSSVFGSIQPASDRQDDPLVNGGVDERSAQSQVLRGLVTPPAVGTFDRVILLGDFQEPEFLSPTLAFRDRLTNLTETIPTAERYTVINQGASAAHDHIFVTGNMMNSARCETVHVNSEFADTVARGSDHDPVVASLLVHSPLPFEARALDGSYTAFPDPSPPSFGMAGRPYRRTTRADFADGMNYPRGSTSGANPDPLIIMQSDLPSARLVSNLLSRHPVGVESAARLSSWTWQWGQFIDHDFGLSGGPGTEDPRELFPIPVPVGDPEFDPFHTGTQVIPFTRSAVSAGSGESSPRETPNTITSFIDGSNVYGSDDLRAVNLRTFVGGSLATTPGPDGDLLAFNRFGRANANDVGAPEEALFLAGDVRANEQCALSAAHTLFVREHNRLAAEIAARGFAGADLGDPAIDDEIYQRARKWVGALIQAITYEEFLPAVLGTDALPPHRGFDWQVDASLSQEFANAAFRVGHTMVTPELPRFDTNGTAIPEGPLPLRDAFFNPDEVTGIGIDPYLRGLARQVQQEIDRFVIEDVRSFLFGPPGAGGLDLAALNIQRGRDHGLPSLNDARELLGLPRYADYDGISSDPATAAGLEAAYGAGRIDDVDLWIGGISEDHLPGSQLGETFQVIWVEQFTNLRGGDLYWYESDPFFSPEDVAEIRATTLADIIRRNSGARVQDDVFHVPPRRLAVLAFSFERNSNRVTMTWRSEGGEAFEVQASDDYGRGSPFTTIVSTTGLTGSTTVTFFDPGAGGSAARAYRVIER